MCVCEGVCLWSWIDILNTVKDIIRITLLD